MVINSHINIKVHTGVHTKQIRNYEFDYIVNKTPNRYIHKNEYIHIYHHTCGYNYQYTCKYKYKYQFKHEHQYVHVKIYLHEHAHTHMNINVNKHNHMNADICIMKTNTHVNRHTLVKQYICTRT